MESTTSKDPELVKATVQDADNNRTQRDIEISEEVANSNHSDVEDEDSLSGIDTPNEDIAQEKEPSYDQESAEEDVEISDPEHREEEEASPNENSMKVKMNKASLTRRDRNTRERRHDNAFFKDDDSSREDTSMDIMQDRTWPSATMILLSEPEFDVWRLGRDGMVDHLEYMYHDLGVSKAWRIPRLTLRMFLLAVRERYQDNPYHNFKHSFSVTQMVYSMICKLNLVELLSIDDLGMLLTAAVCHDVDHPGLSNGYHSHAHSPLAILYDYKSILEQHHFAVTCRILTNKERNIFQNVANRDEILSDTRTLILSTDLALHKDIMTEFAKRIQNFSFSNRSDVMSLMKIIIKCADVSNEVRPENIATPWVERLFSEYFEQSAREKRERLPLTPYMDPDKVDVTDSQEGFIKGIMLPMYSELANLLEDAKLYYVNPLQEALRRYELQKRRQM